MAVIRTEVTDVTAEELERVHTVTERYDGPVRGIADFRGRPHYYERQFDAEADEWSDIYWLTPIDPETFALAMEAWEIWRRWETAYHEKRTTLATHPALPEDRARSDELATILDQRLVIDRRCASVAEGRFEWNTEAGAWGPLRVKWRPHVDGERAYGRGV
jgi:hypothetical protein